LEEDRADSFSREVELRSCLLEDLGVCFDSRLLQVPTVDQLVRGVLKLPPGDPKSCYTGLLVARALSDYKRLSLAVAQMTIVQAKRAYARLIKVAS